MRPPLSRLPLLPVAIAMMVGIAVSYYTEAPLPVAGIAFITAAVLAIAHRHYAAIMAATISIGSLCLMVHTPAAIPESLGGVKARYSATVDAAKEGESSVTLTCLVDSAEGKRLPHPFKALVTYISLFPKINEGDRIRFTADMTSPQTKCSLPDEWDYAEWLKSHGFTAMAMITPDDMIAVDREHGISIFRKMHQALMDKLMEIPLDNATHEFLGTTLLGEKSLIDPEVRQELARVGIAHMLALSGLHIGIIMALLSLALFPLTLMRYNRLRIILSIAAIWVFAAITGMNASVVRAVVMATFVAGGRLLQRETDGINALAGAAIAILLFTPTALMEMGFQLSFVAVAAILTLGEKLNPIPRRSRLHFIGSYFGATTAAMLSAGILSAVWLHVFPVYFLIGNLIASLLLPVLLGLTIIALGVSGVTTVPRFLCILIDAIYGWMQKIAHFITSLPGSSISDIYVSGWVLIPIALAIVSLGLRLHTGRRAYAIAAITFLAMTAALTILTQRIYPQSGLYVTANNRYAVIVVHDADSLYIITGAPEREHATVIEQAEQRYADFRGRRGLKHFSIAPDRIDGTNLVKRGDVFDFGGKRRVLVNSPTAYPDSTADIGIAYISKGFTGDIVELYRTMRPDSVILLADIHKRRAKRYLNECKEANIPAEIFGSE